MAADSNSPVFVIGAPRSGTTLMAKILGRHSRLFMPGETHYLDDIYFRQDELGDIADEETRKRIAEKLYDHYERYYEMEDQERIKAMFNNSDDLATAIAGCSSYGGVFDRFMKIQMKYLGKSRWGNNAPRDLFNAEEIKQIFPEAKFIVCVRDIRGFLLSYKDKWKIVKADKHVIRLKKLYHPVVTSYLWKASMKKLLKLKDRLSEKDICIVYYERLVTSPEQTIRQVCDMLGEEFQQSMLEVDTHNSSSEKASKGIFSSSAERWKTHLSQEEISIGQFIGKREMAKLGYQPVSTGVNPFIVILLWVQTPVSLWRAINANKDVRGPLMPYMFRRLSALFK